MLSYKNLMSFLHISAVIRLMLFNKVFSLYKTFHCDDHRKLLPAAKVCCLYTQCRQRWTCNKKRAKKKDYLTLYLLACPYGTV